MFSIAEYIKVALFNYLMESFIINWGFQCLIKY